MSFQKNSPNSCLQHGVLALNLDNCLVALRFASRWRPSFLSHVCSAVRILDSALFRMLLWLQGKSTLRSTSCSSLIAWASKCCCSPCHTQNEKVRHLSFRPLLSSTSFKHDSNYKHSWSAWFLSWSLSIHLSSNTTVIISILGVPDFWLDRLILRIFIFPKEILKFWSVDGFDDIVSFS